MRSNYEEYIYTLFLLPVFKSLHNKVVCRIFRYLKKRLVFLISTIRTEDRVRGQKCSTILTVLFYRRSAVSIAISCYIIVYSPVLIMSCRSLPFTKDHYNRDYPYYNANRDH